MWTVLVRLAPNRCLSGMHIVMFSCRPKLVAKIKSINLFSFRVQRCFHAEQHDVARLGKDPNE
jgi:hypothetical protein